LVNVLSQRDLAGRVVIDETVLTGTYDFSLLIPRGTCRITSGRLRNNERVLMRMPNLSDRQLTRNILQWGITRRSPEMIVPAIRGY
jgi:hypothetical protein